jgi:hypothetical protein
MAAAVNAAAVGSGGGTVEQGLASHGGPLSLPWDGDTVTGNCGRCGDFWRRAHDVSPVTDADREDDYVHFDDSHGSSAIDASSSLSVGGRAGLLDQIEPSMLVLASMLS